MLEETPPGSQAKWAEGNFTYQETSSDPSQGRSILPEGTPLLTQVKWEAGNPICGYPFKSQVSWGSATPALRGLSRDLSQVGSRKFLL